MRSSDILPGTWPENASRAMVEMLKGVSLPSAKLPRPRQLLLHCSNTVHPWTYVPKKRKAAALDGMKYRGDAKGEGATLKIFSGINR